MMLFDSAIGINFSLSNFSHCKTDSLSDWFATHRMLYTSQHYWLFLYMSIMPESAHEFDEEFKSKTEIKREMLELQDFAMSLVKLSKHQRSKVPFSDELKESLVVADKIKDKPDALRRHVRFMAKVLLETDLVPIQQALDVMANKHQQESSKHTKLEQLRDLLINGDNDTIEAILAQHDGLERQKLRQLIRLAAKEKKAEKPAKHYQQLFGYLKEHITL